MLWNVGPPCHSGRVRVTENDVARVPVGNLRVPRADFGALWAAAELRCEEQAARGVADWYTAGVAATCEWLAGAVVQPAAGAPYLALSPATGRTARAYEELIDDELAAAERLAAREPRPAQLVRRPGWIEGIVATLRWAWRAGAAPLQLDEARTG